MSKHSPLPTEFGPASEEDVAAVLGTVIEGRRVIDSLPAALPVLAGEIDLVEQFLGAVFTELLVD